MGTLLTSLGGLIDAVGAMIVTAAGALTSAGIYMAGPVTELQVFSGTYEAAYGAALAASGGNVVLSTAIATGAQTQAMAQTDTMTAFFSGIGAPFIAVTGQLMQDTSTILVTLPDVFTAVNTFLTNLATFLQ